jgi:membrane associated rhomboid family serine protease
VLPLKDENPTQRRPYVTIALIVACAAVYFLWQPSPFSNTASDVDFNVRRAAIPCEVVHGRPLTIDELRATYSNVAGREDSCEAGSPTSPAGFPHKSIWGSILVSLFLHGGVVHLAGNLLFLWIFGNNIEDRLGHVRFLGFYLVGGVVATWTHVLLDVHSTVPMIGASGAIAAVMGAYLVWFPDAPVRTAVLAFVIPLILRIRAKWVLIFWFLLQFLTSPNSGVAWAAHVGGFVFGALVGLLVRAFAPVRRVSMAPPHRRGPWDPTGGAGYSYYDRS